MTPVGKPGPLLAALSTPAEILTGAEFARINWSLSGTHGSGVKPGVRFPELFYGEMIGERPKGSVRFGSLLSRAVSGLLEP